MSSRLRIRCLGPLEVERDGGERPRFASESARALLAYLAVHSEAPQRRLHLAGLLWPDQPEEVALTNLRQALKRLRDGIGDRHAEPPFLLIDRRSVRLNPLAPIWVDVPLFRRLLGDVRAHAHPDLSACFRCQQRLEEAAALYRGPLLEGFSVPSPLFESWLQQERERWAAEALDLFRSLTQALEARGERERALRAARRWLALAPWDEGALRTVMTLLLAAGQRGEALNEFERIRAYLEEELGVEPEPETLALAREARRTPVPVAARREGRPERPPRRRPPGNLPEPLLPFFGREEERALLRQWLLDPQIRWITLVGEGGVGKTRLALEVAREVAHAFVDGVWFVPLGAQVDLEDLSPQALQQALVGAVLNALDLPLQRQGTPEDQLLAFLRGRELLLVLDNFEPWLAGADVVWWLLRETQGVKVLITSRERLRFQAERVFRLEGFPVSPGPPDPKGRRPACLDLLEERARRQNPAFSLTPQELPDALALCRRVNGLPLGIELAASLAAELSCRTLLRRLEEGLDVLRVPFRDLPPRHRSLRALFESHWSLLDDRARGWLAAATLFRGGIAPEAFEAVVGGADEALPSLAEAFLLQPQADGRYHLHPLVREFAAERFQALEGKGLLDGAALRHRFLSYFLELAARMGEALRARHPEAALQVLRAEAENLRLAWQWAVARREEAAVRQGLDGLLPFYELQGWFEEGRRLLLLVLQAWGEDPAGWRDRALQVRLLAWLGRFLYHLGAYPAAWEVLDRALRRAWEERAPSEELFVRVQLARVANAQGRYGEAREILEKARTLAQETEDLRGLEEILGLLGIWSYFQGRYDEAERHFQESLALAEELGDLRIVAAASNNLGNVRYARGDPKGARRYLRRSLEIFLHLGFWSGAASSLDTLGNVALAEGRWAESEDAFARALILAREIHSVPLMLESLTGLAELWLQQGRRAEARALLAWLLRRPDQVEALRLRVERLRDRLPDRREEGSISLPFAWSPVEVVGWAFARMKVPDWNPLDR